MPSSAGRCDRLGATRGDTPYGRCKEVLRGDRLGVNGVYHRSVSRGPTPRWSCGCTRGQLPSARSGANRGARWST